MKKLETINSTNKIIKNRKEIMDIIKKDWANLQGCNIEDFDAGIKFIIDSQNPKLINTKKIKEEVQVLILRNGGMFINVSDECFPELSEIVQNFGVNQEKIGELLQRKYKGVLTPYCSV